MNQPTHACNFLGDAGRQGIYLLHVQVTEPLAIRFGRFQRGQPITLLPGSYLYVGSALGRQGATTLAGRLLRHTTRGGALPPHAIQPDLWAQLQEGGMIPHNRSILPRPKRCFWHIDYLVEQLAAEITQIIALRTPHRLESKLARQLATLPRLSPVAPGLGASDDPQATHLWRVDADASWWHTLPAQLIGMAES
ncbi:MAG: GIY-YIG nuclease family protein [Caldilineaceae bacterium]|nr:GIY-YIG nuclease family protein [Caldilineaceae bacterium]